METEQQTALTKDGSISINELITGQSFHSSSFFKNGKGFLLQVLEYECVFFPTISSHSSFSNGRIQ